MFDTRIIRRLAYDGNYQRAIELIVDIIDGKKNYLEVKEDLEKRRKNTPTKDYAALEAKFKALEQECTTLSWFAAFQENKANKYKQTLQEIKGVAEELLEKGLEPQSVEHQLRLRGKRELASIILDLITKAEEE